MRVGERERRWQVKWFCGRGGLSFTVIQALSGWRRGKVKWRGAPWHSSVSPPPPPPITDNSCAVWWLLSGRMGAGDKSVTYIYFLLEDHASVSFWLRVAPPTYLYLKVSSEGSTALLKDILTKIEVGVGPLMLHLTYIMLQISRASKRCNVYGRPPKIHMNIQPLDPIRFKWFYCLNYTINYIQIIILTF